MSKTIKDDVENMCKVILQLVSGWYQAGIFRIDQPEKEISLLKQYLRFLFHTFFIEKERKIVGSTSVEYPTLDLDDASSNLGG